MADLRITILSGYASPETLEFGEGEREIRIGRAPEAEVRLDPSRDTAASRGVHARLVRGADDGDETFGAWQLESLHASGVGIIGAGDRVIRRLEEGERTPLLEGLTLEIGVNGPRLRVEDAGAALPGTEVQESRVSVVPHVPQDVIGKARWSSRRVRVVSVVGAAIALLAAVAIFAVNRSSQQGVAGARQAAQEQIAGVREETQSSIAEAREEAREGLEQLRALTSEQAAALASQLGALKGEVARVEAEAVDRMDEILARVAQSVWSVGVEDAQGAFTHVGTAWTAASDTLVTNAHVAEGLARALRRIEGSRAVARRSGAEAGSLRIGSATIHPGYQQWIRALSSQFTGLAGGGAKSVSFIAPADVATLRVESGDPGEPLPLADVASGSAAARGAVVGYVGYPSENLAGFPTLQTVVGRVTATTDFFFGEDAARENQLIHYDAPTVGGASGSPLVNRFGEVVGVVSAGSVVMANEHGDRVPVGFNYAQRVDFVAELLAGQAERNQLARNERWSDRLREVALQPAEIVDRLVAETAEAVKSDAPEPVGEGVYTLTGAGLANAVRVRLPMAPGYRYLVVAVAEDWTDIDLVVTSGDRRLGLDDAIDWYPVVLTAPVAEAASATVHIVAATQPLSGECRVTLRVMRFAAP